MKRKTARYLVNALALTAIVGLLGCGGYYAVRSGLFRLQVVRVEILNAAELGSDGLVADIQSDLNQRMRRYVGQNIWDLSLRDLQDQLRASTWVDHGEIHRRLPDVVEVSVRLKPLASVLVNEKGQLMPVSTAGELMDPVSSAKVPNVPVLVGSIFEKDEATRKRAVQMIAEIPNNGMFSKSNISEVHYKSVDGFWVTMMHSGLQVKLGEEQVGLKSERVAQVLEYIESHSLDARVIDANLSKKVLVRLRKDP